MSASPAEPSTSPPGPGGIAIPQPIGDAVAGPARSVTPRVLGILAVVSACQGFILTLAMTFGYSEEFNRYFGSTTNLGGLEVWMQVYLYLALAVGVLHTTAGIQSILYTPTAPLMMTLYGAFALLVPAADIVLSVSLFPESPTHLMAKLPGGQNAAFDDIVAPRILLGILSFPWPIVVLVLMNLEPARRACRGGLPLAR